MTFTILVARKLLWKALQKSSNKCNEFSCPIVNLALLFSIMLFSLAYRVIFHNYCSTNVSRYYLIHYNSLTLAIGSILNVLVQHLILFLFRKDFRLQIGKPGDPRKPTFHPVIWFSKYAEPLVSNSSFFFAFTRKRFFFATQLISCTQIFGKINSH